MHENGNFLADIFNGIADGIVASFAAFVGGLILGVLNPILTSIGLDPVTL